MVAELAGHGFHSEVAAAATGAIWDTSAVSSAERDTGSDRDACLEHDGAELRRVAAVMTSTAEEHLPVPERRERHEPLAARDHAVRRNVENDDGT